MDTLVKTFGTKSGPVYVANEEQFAADMHALSGYCCSSAVLSSRLPHDWVLSVYM